MSDKPGSPAPAAANSAAVERMRVARKARESQNAAAGELPEATKFAIRQTHAASKVSRLLANRLKGGETVSPELMRCLGNFVTIGSGELFS